MNHQNIETTTTAAVAKTSLEEKNMGRKLQEGNHMDKRTLRNKKEALISKKVMEEDRAGKKPAAHTTETGVLPHDHRKEVRHKEVRRREVHHKEKKGQQLKGIRELRWPAVFTVGILLVVIVAAKLIGSETFDLLNAANLLTSLFTTVLAAFTWIGIQKLRNTKPRVPKTVGSDSAIVIVDIGNLNIAEDVRTYCENEETFYGMLHGAGFRNKDAFEDANNQIDGSGFEIEGVRPTERVVVLSRGPLREVTDTAEHVYKAFGSLDAALHLNGISDLYIFYAGPVVVPFYIGELLSNRFRVYIYKYLGGDGDKYTFSGMMNHLEYMK